MGQIQARVDKMFKCYLIVWAVCISLLSMVCFKVTTQGSSTDDQRSNTQIFVQPFVHHAKALFRLVGNRVRTAMTARTTLDVSRALWGSPPPGLPANDPDCPDWEDDAAGLHIRSDSLALLCMVSILFGLGLLCLLHIGLSMRYPLSSSTLYVLQYTLGNVLIVTMAFTLDVLYLWPPMIRFVVAYSKRLDARLPDVSIGWPDRPARGQEQVQSDKQGRHSPSRSDSVRTDTSTRSNYGNSRRGDTGRDELPPSLAIRLPRPTISVPRDYLCS